MRSPNREVSVFSTAALDLFASALGAFILLAILLFPYYRKAGPESAPSQVSEQIQKRREALRSVADMLADTITTEARITELEARADQLRRRMVTQREELYNLEKKLAEEPTEEPQPEPVQPFIEDGVEFSLLGIGTERKSFLVVIDLSGSMDAYADLMIDAVLEVLEPLGPDNRFAILGYSGMGTARLEAFPGGSRLLDGTPDNLRRAAAFTRGLANDFGGSTPTHRALLNALQYDVEAIILLSDGEPDGAPSQIVNDITRLNRRIGKEIHTVALGNYTSPKQKNLVLFLQQLAARNNGDFVGVSR
jgi:hypothetical protein